MDTQTKLQRATLILRVGIAFTFAYAVIDAFIEPALWTGYLPQFLESIVPAQQLLWLFSAYEALLALWLLWGKGMKYAGIFVALTMAGIIATNLQVLIITFRDI